MIALTTPAPVYWLLDLIQTIGIIGILAGVWYLPYAMQRRNRPADLHILMRSVPGRIPTTGRQRRDRGAGRIETVVAWAVFLGAAAGAWALIVFFLAGRVGA